MTKRVVLIGHPVAHSLSGAMQQAAFDELGIDATYELWDRAPIDLGEAIVEIRGDDFLGANVTIPHKERVVPMVDRLTEEAQATGAVNTLTREGRRLVGHNTDVAGFKVALDKIVGPPEDAAPGGRARARAVARGPSSTASSARGSSGSSCSTATSTGPRAWSSISAGAPRTWSCARCPGMSRSSSRSSPRPSCS